MKNVLFIVAVAVSMLALTGCGGSADNGTEYATYKEALAANDFEAAHKILDQAEIDKSKCDGDSDKKRFAKKYGIDYYDIDGKGLQNAKKEVFDQEVKFLVADGSEEANARIVFLFSDFEIEGKRLPEGINDYIYGHGAKYPGSVKAFNERLDMVMDLCILQENKGLAQKLLKLYKQNVEVFMGGSGHSKTEKSGRTRYFDIAPDGTEVDGNHCYVTYNWKDKEAAQIKYEEQFGQSNDNDE